jgi:hypothetical protein
MRGALVAIALLCGMARADSPEAAATALFDQGIKDMGAGNLDAACKELAASLAKVADSGTKGALALCETKRGRIASAWVLWKELADQAPPDIRAAAAAKAAELEAKLPRYVLVLHDPPAGLVVAIDGTTVDATISVPIPIDPGSIKVTARAPGYQDFTQSYQMAEGTTTRVEIAMTAAAKPPDVHTVPVTPVDTHVAIVSQVPPEKPPAKRRGWKWIAAGVVLAGIGLALDQAPSSAHNHQLDATDFIPAACYGLGGTAIVLGVF